ncbi:MAG: sensor histidine kinase [Cyclobacteriaceae bacterium]|nr:sensor histidine kinase [Cyclobacteriaceae bacterium]
MDKYIFITTSFLLLGCLQAKAIDEPKLDSLQTLLNHANKTDSIKYLLLVGEEYFAAEDYSQALDRFFICLKHAESLKNIAGIADAANNIGRVYYNMENFSTGLEYFKKALYHYKAENDEQRAGGVYNNIALVYYELDSVDLAIDYYKQALAIKEKHNDKLNVAAIYHNLGLVYINQNKFDEAINSMVSSKVIFEELGYSKHAANTTNNIGRAYYKKKDYEKALPYFIQGLEEAKKLHSPFLMMDNYKYQADCYGKMENYKSAYWYSNEYHNLKDSLLNIEKEKELAEIQSKYQNEIAESENRLLKKENEANTATIRLQYLFGIGIFIITLLSIVMAIIYYRGNQTKERANELLHKQKAEIEEKNMALSLLNDEITKQHDEIKTQKKKLEELNGIKDKLFSIISHEFRSPLNSLKGTLALLKIGAISPHELNLISRELTDKINSTSIFLDNLLNWAKSQMQGISARPTMINLREMAEENVQMLRSMADKKKINLQNNIREDCTAFVDPNMINLIFKNLISNAIKFSLRGGTIDLSAKIENDMNVITVTDDGIGMSPENLKMLFQVQTFTTRGTANERGTGLGLYITKNFIESNDGQIWVESQEGAGTTFTFTIPTRKQNPG